MKLGRLLSSRLFLALLALANAPITTAAKSPSALDSRESISDGQPTRDNVLLLPSNGQLSSNRIDALLVPSKLWPREQESICVMNYAACTGTEFCCPEGNVCCPGEFSLLLADASGGQEDAAKVPYNPCYSPSTHSRWNVLWSGVRLPLLSVSASEYL